MGYVKKARVHGHMLASTYLDCGIFELGGFNNIDIINGQENKNHFDLI